MQIKSKLRKEMKARRAEISDKSKKDKLIEEFGEVFTGNSQVVNRAVMAKILSTIPVFFNTQQEIKDYIDNALVRCSNRSEVLACYVIIQGIMED